MLVMSNSSPERVPVASRPGSPGAGPALTRATNELTTRAAWLDRQPVHGGGRARFGVTLGLSLTPVTRSSLAAPGGLETAAGQIAGLTGSYLLLVMLLLIARLPWLESLLGQDRLVRWHRRLGPWPIILLGSHAVLITVGYAAQASVGPWHEFDILLTSYPDVLMATVASACW